MSYGLLYYLFIICGGLVSLLITINVIYVIGLITISFAGAMSESCGKSGDGKIWFDFIRKYWWVGIVSFLLTVITPNKKDLIIITGLHVSTQTIDEGLKMPPKIMKLFNKEIDEILGEDKKKKDK